ncbi:unnamed protein product [Rotaria socialis]|uniref:MULE transposase domain-containing protein n=1 Tax=Rotaria socialis TaxID=392032 RepID=A0A817XIS0_9BILA|nr:unnamed protein product [Rotaria socialis]
MANFTVAQAYESSSESDDEMKVDETHTPRKPIVRRSVPFRGKLCNAAIHLYYPNDSSEVLLFRTDNEHDHTNSTQRKDFSEEVKQHIDELFDLKLKPKKIYEVLREKKLIITFNQLKNYLIQLHDIDDNEDATDGENKFRFFISTKRLLEIAFISTRIHADATYKLNWQGFPVLIVGATDSDRKLHPFGLAVCSNEEKQDFEFIFKSISNGVEQIVQSKFMPEVLIVDGSDAIRNAFKTIFDNDKIVMRWAHMRRHVNKKLSNVGCRQEILDDIEKLQLCESEKVFNKASLLFVKKWGQREHDFLKYFENEWLQTVSSWYEGYNYFTPSTNNSLEVINRVIKDEHTFRERHPLSRFFVIANNIVRSWSKPRDLNQIDPIIFSSEPTIKLKKWTDGYHFAKSSKLVLQMSSSRKDVTDYYIPAGD